MAILKNSKNQKPKKDSKKTSDKKQEPEKKYRASFKEKKVYMRKPKLSEINELKIVVVIVPRDHEMKLATYISDRGGVILSKNRAKGISRASLFSGVGANEVPVSVIFSAVRGEDSENLITKLSNDFRLDIPGNGKAFMIDVLGYMGAKAPFIEKRSVR